jgi:DNA-binding HxlR family transcriptional regulator
MDCSIARTLEVVGDWWTLLIVRDVSLGFGRFDDFQRRLGIATNVLAARLDWLVEHGVLERHPYQDNPPRHEYRLTDKGVDLGSVLFALRTWGDKWEADAGPRTVTVHDTCGHRTDLRLVCTHCGERLRRGETHVEAAPAGAEPAWVGEGRPAG